MCQKSEDEVIRRAQCLNCEVIFVGMYVWILAADKNRVFSYPGWHIEYLLVELKLLIESMPSDWWLRLQSHGHCISRTL